MNDPSLLSKDPGVDKLSQLDRADRICDAYERELQERRHPLLEDYLSA